MCSCRLVLRKQLNATQPWMLAQTSSKVRCHFGQFSTGSRISLLYSAECLLVSRSSEVGRSDTVVLPLRPVTYHQVQVPSPTIEARLSNPETTPTAPPIPVPYHQCPILMTPVHECGYAQKPMGKAVGMIGSRGPHQGFSDSSLSLHLGSPSPKF
jgi:hypothetical protein